MLRPEHSTLRMYSKRPSNRILQCENENERDKLQKYWDDSSLHMWSDTCYKPTTTVKNESKSLANPDWKWPGTKWHKLTITPLLYNHL